LKILCSYVFIIGSRRFFVKLYLDLLEALHVSKAESACVAYGLMIILVDKFTVKIRVCHFSSDFDTESVTSDKVETAAVK